MSDEDEVRQDQALAIAGVLLAGLIGLLTFVLHGGC